MRGSGQVQSNGTRMKSYKPTGKPIRPIGSCFARLILASLGALLAASDGTSAASLLKEQTVESRPIGEPVMAIVSLHDQQITIYDAKGWTMRAPVSSGQQGRETPAGIFSVIQKEAEHYSNIYDDAYMPHMQRLTWSGIAIHGGVLPGYPASHGCIRMPFGFAERLFDATSLGMRVIVAPGNVAPIAIDHPALFEPKAGPNAAAATAAETAAAEANKAASNAEQARLAAMNAYRESIAATVLVRKMEIVKFRADAQAAAAERAIAAADSPETKAQASDAKAKAAAQVTEAEAQLASAQVQLQPKRDAVAAAREAARAAEAARVVAIEAARNAARELEPLSVFISRKTQHLYIRQALQPILEIPVTIQDPDRPIGTHIFTAMERTGAALRWSVVSLVGRDESRSSARESHDRDVEVMSTDLGNAKSALDRIVIPQDTADHIAELISPRSSLIISDEALSPETGNGTDFVVLMSGEPQGGIKHRRPSPQVDVRYYGLHHWRSPTAGAYSSWWR